MRESTGIQSAIKLLDESDKKTAQQTTGGRLAEFIGSKWFKSLIDSEKKVEEFKPVICWKGSQKINGYNATALADFCDLMLDARNKNLGSASV